MDVEVKMMVQGKALLGFSENEGCRKRNTNMHKQ